MSLVDNVMRLPSVDYYENNNDVSAISNIPVGKTRNYCSTLSDSPPHPPHFSLPILFTPLPFKHFSNNYSE
jgi:hypothetical protein